MNAALPFGVEPVGTCLIRTTLAVAPADLRDPVRVAQVESAMSERLDTICGALGAEVFPDGKAVARQVQVESHVFGSSERLAWSPGNDLPSTTVGATCIGTILLDLGDVDERV